jgi:hypothetical protein
LTVGQDTLVRLLKNAVGFGVCWIDGFGVRWMDHRVPFQRSAKLSSFSPTKYPPTAVHAVSDGHDTAERMLLTPLAGGFAPGGLAGRWMDHLVPFQRSMSISPERLAVLYDPTALQLLSDAHDTASRPQPAAPLGSAARSIDHLLPFQRSTSAPPLNATSPTAVQAVLEGQDTPARPAFWTLGVRRIDHLLPFQRSTRVESVRLVRDPTATQNLREAHDTFVNEPPGGVGAGWNDQLVPFQSPASATSGVGRPGKERLQASPTAVHAFLDGHDTARRPLRIQPAGIGMG